MTKLSVAGLRSKIVQMESIPSMPSILVPMLRHLEEPSDSVDLQKIVDLISHDKALAAQTLHMANSPLFGQWKRIESVRMAVMTLGLTRMRDIATSCCMLNILPRTASRLDPAALWEHSLACAFVSRRLAKKVGLPEPEKAYLAGLLHDIGLITNLVAIPEEFERAVQYAFEKRVPIAVAESEVLGFTHTVTGDLLAEHWGLGPEVREVIRRHHRPEHALSYRTLAAVVNLSDLLCRMSRLGLGYDEELQVDFTSEPGWQILSQECRGFRQLDFAKFAAELDDYVKEVRDLVAVIFRLT